MSRIEKAFWDVIPIVVLIILAEAVVVAHIAIGVALWNLL